MSEQQERPKVRIACHQVNGLMLQNWKPGYDDGTGDGVKTVIKDGPAIRLNGPSAREAGVGNTERTGAEPGITEVDAEWWGKFETANRGKNPLIDDKIIEKMDDPPANPT